MNLSNGEYVIKASSAKAIGAANLNAMNATGRTPGNMAGGGHVGRGASRSQAVAYGSLNSQIARLTAVISQQTRALSLYSDTLKSSIDQFSSYVNLSAIDTQGKSTGDVLQELVNRKAKTGNFQSTLASLSKRGLNATALSQVASAGPESDLANLLLNATSYDIGLINQTLGGAGGYGAGIANSVSPGGGALAKKVAAEQKTLAAKKKKAAQLKPVRGKGATIQYAGGKVNALFSSKELQNQALVPGTYVTVLIDGKEVTAIVKRENAKVNARNGRAIKSGRS